MASLPRALQMFLLALYMVLLQALIVSPVIALVICSVMYTSRARLSPSERPRLFRGFISYALAGAAIGFLGALLFVIAATMGSDSGNGPLGLILYGPLAVSIGAIGGSLVWRRRSRPLPAL
jgi:ABC-type Fe3+ transport system permease subunit